MAAGFKEQVKRDIAAVFNNADEHADKVNVKYNGRDYSISVIIDSAEARERVKPSTDHSEGIFAADITAYMSFYDLGIVPRKNTPIVLDGTSYNIAHVAYDMGEITLDLEMLDE